MTQNAWGVAAPTKGGAWGERRALLPAWARIAHKGLGTTPVAGMAPGRA